MEFVQALAGVSPEELVVVAQRCERAGFAQVAISDHLARPVSNVSGYPYMGRVAMPFHTEMEWPDPWVTAATILSSTTTLKVVTDILVLPLRGVLETANAVATLTRLYGNRLVLGIGVGWMRDEFDAANRTFDDRAARTEQMVTTMRSLWRGHSRGAALPGSSFGPG